MLRDVWCVTRRAPFDTVRAANIGGTNGARRQAHLCLRHWRRQGRLDQAVFSPAGMIWVIQALHFLRDFAIMISVYGCRLRNHYRPILPDCSLMPKCTCAFSGIEFRMLGCLKSAHKPLGRQMAGEYIVSQRVVE
jgi:hypothetical protein